MSQPISEEAPCGEDLEYDPAFQEMETLAQPKEEQEFGDSVTPFEPPDWEGVGEKVADLLGRTRDLRVLVHGAAASLNTSGIGAFRQALEAINVCLEQFWDSVHPQLDEEDGNDPIMRLNALNNLDDTANFARGLRRCTLVSAKGVGSFSLHHIDLAEGRAKPNEDEDVPDLALVKGAFNDADPETTKQLVDDIDGALEALEQMRSVWNDKLAETEGDADTAGMEPGAENTVATLRELRQQVLKMAPVAVTATVEEDDAVGDDDADAGPRSNGAIRNRDDIIRSLDRICEYYSRNEPSSPVPMLLRRAQRLVDKSFFEILQDVAPESVKQVEIISGRSSDE